MDEGKLLDVCRGENGVWLGRTPQGQLFVRREGAWQPYDFNGLHRGYYPRCTFTALARASGVFYLAGTDEKGWPHLFLSLLGGVWEERELVAKHPLKGEVRAEGEVVRILYDDREKQVFLLCWGGRLVTLPDCPKCVRILPLRRPDVTDGRLESGKITVYFADGSEQCVAVENAVQYRVALSFAQNLMKQGGVLADVRTAQDYARDALPGSVNVPLEQLDLWLNDQPKTRPMVFVCRTGSLADVAVRYARRFGFSQAYSLGGTHEWAHLP